MKQSIADLIAYARAGHVLTGGEVCHIVDHYDAVVKRIVDVLRDMPPVYSRRDRVKLTEDPRQRSIFDDPVKH